MKIRKKRIVFVDNIDAVLGLPMRMTVSLIIGTVALVAILSYILNPCLFPQRMVVSVTPILTILPGADPENVTFTVYVNDTDGHPLQGASIIIKGLGGAGSGLSDKNGKAVIQTQVRLEGGIHEGYLDISVKAPCHTSFEHQDMIKVVKSPKV
jgi:hypothetical protein